jgi:hypothetical protein
MRVLLLLPLLPAFVSSQLSEYEIRKENLISDALVLGANPTGIAPLQAAVGAPIPQSSLDALVQDLTSDPKADFRIVQLIRILFLDTTNTYGAQILNALSDSNLKYWLTPDDDLRVYWSENHHIMWMSSAYLLEESHNVDTNDPQLVTRLTTYLKTKIQYGYYEFYSTLYLPYTLSGLLNLVDFCQDATIQDLATRATLRLLSDFVKCINSEGVCFPTAGRNQVSNYLEPYDSNYNSIVWLLTGLGTQPTTVYHVGAFLVTSNIDVSSIEWTPTENTVLSIGHPLSQTDDIYKDLTRVDRTLAQWSFGGYFHPDVIDDTQTLLEEYDLQDHGEFKRFESFSLLPQSLVTLLDKVTKSSVICQQDVSIFRNGPVALSSVQDFWPGQLGYQQFPWMAAIGRLAVWIQSGVSDYSSTREWGDSDTSNSHLPYIKQEGNVALVMYNADPTYKLALGMVGIDNFDVSLRWPSDADWNAQERVGNWFLGRQWGGFIAVRSHCGGTVCTEDQQTWAVVVGTPDLYGDFETFKQAIETSTFDQGIKGGWVSEKRYYGKIGVKGPDGTNVAIEHNWY